MLHARGQRTSTLCRRRIRNSYRFYISSGPIIELYCRQRCWFFLETWRRPECTPGEGGLSAPVPRGLPPCCRRRRGRIGRNSADRTAPQSPRKRFCFANGRPADPRSGVRFLLLIGTPPPPSLAAGSITTI